MRSVVSYEYGRLFGIRIKDRTRSWSTCPTPVAKDSELTLTIAYGGRLEPQTAGSRSAGVRPAGDGQSRTRR